MQMHCDISPSINQTLNKLSKHADQMGQWTSGDMLTLCVQAQIFAPGPPNCRRVIVGTNIAETSITVEGVVYVIDPGLVKQKSHNSQTGMDSLEVISISRLVKCPLVMHSAWLAVMLLNRG